MTRTTRAVVGLVTLAGLAVVLLFGWPTLYRYEHVGTANRLVRIHRITGEVSVLAGGGWRPLARYEPPPAVPAVPAAPAAPRSALDSLLASDAARYGGRASRADARPTP